MKLKSVRSWEAHLVTLSVVGYSSLCYYANDYIAEIQFCTFSSLWRGEVNQRKYDFSLARVLNAPEIKIMNCVSTTASYSVEGTVL